MFDALFHAMASLNWYEVIKTGAAAVTAAVAVLALRNWQRQDKAKREMEFLDGLLDAAQTYIADIGRTIEFVKYTKLGMGALEDGDGEGKATKAAIKYIRLMGETDGKRILQELDAARPSTVKLRWLGFKGQVFKFDGYAECLNAITMLTWQFDRIQALAIMIAQPSLNWEHPDVSKVLSKVIEIDSEQVRKSVSDSQVTLLKFVQDTYVKTYGARARKRRANAK